MERTNFKLDKTLDVLTFLRTSKKASDLELHAKLDLALEECKSQNWDILGTLFRRILIHIGAVNRVHNIYARKGIVIKSKGNGGQERHNMKSIIKWWVSRMPETFFNFNTLEIIEEFTEMDNLIHNSIESNRDTGEILGVNFLNYTDEGLDFIVSYIATRIRNGFNSDLWAKALPKHDTGQYRTTKKVIKSSKKGVTSFYWTLPYDAKWVKRNGKLIDIDDTVMITANGLQEKRVGKLKIKVSNGDIVSYPRKKQAATLARQSWNAKLIGKLSTVLGLETIEGVDSKGNKFIDYTGYKEFRKTQNTVEQLLASGDILNYSKSQFIGMLNRHCEAPIKLTSGARWRLGAILTYKNNDDKLVAKIGKWNTLGKWFIEWTDYQNQISENIRSAEVSGDDVEKEKLLKKFKIKTTGQQSLDLLIELHKGIHTTGQIDAAYQAYVNNIDFDADAFFSIDGSGSMQRIIKSTLAFKNKLKADKYNNITFMDIAATLAIPFIIKNPNPDFKDVFAWFSNRFYLAGCSQTLGGADAEKIVSNTVGFSENLTRLRRSSPKRIEKTNMFATVDFFVDLVKNKTYDFERLPKTLVFLTDNEINTGKTPMQAYEHAKSIGWNPLFVYWSIEENKMSGYENMPNSIFIGGFNEGALSKVINGLKKGPVAPVDELWTIYDDETLSIVK